MVSRFSLEDIFIELTESTPDAGQTEDEQTAGESEANDQ